MPYKTLWEILNRKQAIAEVVTAGWVLVFQKCFIDQARKTCWGGGGQKRLVHYRLGFFCSVFAFPLYT